MPNRFMPAVDRILIDFASMFELSSPPRRSQPWEKWAIAAIVLAGAVVRFWGLGGWGLEGDEDTMALPAVHILKDGLPLLPSGMFYGRGLAQLYMMAGAMMGFGPSEWAMRLPSVVCGLLLVLLSYWYGRRFLSPVWNMIFVAAVAFLPGTIADSQEARMYIFLLTCLTGYSILVFDWERTGRTSRLVAAVLVMLIGIQFHTLAVFGAFVVFFPGLLRNDRRKLTQGAAAFLVIVTGYELISRWISSLYPPRPRTFGVDKVIAGHDLGMANLHGSWLLLLIGPVLAVAVSVWVAKRIPSGRPARISAGLIAAGLIFQSLMFYHLGLLSIAAGAVVARRYGKDIAPRLLWVLAISVLMAATHVAVLHFAQGVPVRRVLGLLVGLPSIWAYFNLAAFSPVAGLILIAAALQVAVGLAHGHKIGDYWLFLFLGGWLPVFLIGFFSWFTDPRYTEFALMAFLMTAFAPWPRTAPVALAVLAGILVVNPISVARAINSGYTIHPDHKGAALYMKSLTLGPRDIVLAEDVIEQTYYLGHVGYWLVGTRVSSEFIEETPAGVLDIYTHTPVIDTGEKLQRLIASPDRGAVYVIGSGEDQADGRRLVRGDEIDDIMKSGVFHAVYDGRDGLTHVWKIDAPAAPRSPPLDHP